MAKPTLGVFSFTSCSGCQIAILNLEDQLIELMSLFDIKYFHMIQGNNKEVKVDIAIIEGGITTKEQEKKLKRIRKESKILIALGSCACTGGVPAMKNMVPREELSKEIYKKDLKTLPAKGIDRFIDVDYFIRGCPIKKEEFVEAIISILNGKKPYQRPYPVCTECKLNENGCFLDQGKFCLGPVTFMGCGAPCPTQGVPCDGCRGLYDDANLEGLKKLAKEKGITQKEITDMINIYLEDRV